MAFDFPSSPTNGQVFVPPSGPTYIFNGGVWNTVGGYGATFLQQQFITVSGDITLHSETVNFLVELQGGGAGGGNGNSAAGGGSIGSGGGGGAYCAKWIKRPSGVYVPTCTIAATVLYAANGNATTFSDGTNVMTANGGGAGVSGGSAPTIAYPGGNGGTASGGDLNIRGEHGHGGYVFSVGGSYCIIGGRGGSSRFGTGGPTTCNTSGAGAAIMGTAGTGWGVGGGGGVSGNAGGSAGGGVGSPGCALITEFR